MLPPLRDAYQDVVNGRLHSSPISVANAGRICLDSMWTGWKRVLTNVVVLVLGLGLGFLLWIEVLARLFFGRW